MQFKEQQFLGFNKLHLLIRLFLLLFCFIAYYWSENPKPVYTDIGNFRIGSYPGIDYPNSGEIFFMLGIFIILISIALLFIPHFKIETQESHIILTRILNTKTVSISVSDITYLKIKKNERSFFTNPLFDVDKKGVKTFFTQSDCALEITTNNGKKYSIGTNRPLEFQLFLSSKNPAAMILKSV
jgi:hypothetical protein